MRAVPFRDARARASRVAKEAIARLELRALTFRLRVALVAAGAVAAAALGAAAVMYVSVDRQLVSQTDQTLSQTAKTARILGPRPDERGFPFGRTTQVLLSGRGDIFAQIVDASGAVVSADGQPQPDLVTADVRAVAAGQRSEAYADVRSGGLRVRVYAVPFANSRALVLALPVGYIDTALDSTRTVLIQVLIGAVVLAGALGGLVARAALVPVVRLTRTVEEVGRTKDFSRRVASSGRDELARLARSFDALLIGLDSSLRSQRQLVADASHELRTPLTSLRTNLELIAGNSISDPVERQAMARDLVSQIERLTGLVGDLVDLARDEDAPVIVEDVALDVLVRELVDDLRFRYPSVHFVEDTEPLVVRGSKSQLGRAVTNLLDNAAKWSPRDGVVEVRVAASEITVRDHGPGIAVDEEALVFQRFWRSPSAHELPGSGLGLAIVKEIAEAHGGSVTVEHPSGGGTRFRFHVGTPRLWTYAPS